MPNECSKQKGHVSMPAAKPPPLKYILSLCDRTGNWSLPYREDTEHYHVETVDLLGQGRDIRMMKAPPYQVHGILAAPPCTMFSAAGAKHQRTRQQILQALSIVDACLRLVAIYNPVWWALENPVGCLGTWLGPPVMYFNPYDYGDPYEKKTCLWGRFTIPPKTPVPVTGNEEMLSSGKRMSRWYYETSKLKGAARQAVRSETPLGFSYAFFKANP